MTIPFALRGELEFFFFAVAKTLAFHFSAARRWLQCWCFLLDICANDGTVGVILPRAGPRLSLARLSNSIAPISSRYCKGDKRGLS